jgi:hypothetical protein
MQWTRILYVAAMAASFAAGDELHLRDGTVLIGNYVGGGQKEVWFQRTPAGPELFPLYEVESLKFNTVPSIFPSSQRGAKPDSSSHPLNTAGNTTRSTTRSTTPAQVADTWKSRIEWAFALFFPPSLTAQLAHPAH